MDIWKLELICYYLTQFSIINIFHFRNGEVVDEPFILFQVSFVYYSLIGLVIMMVVGAVVSHFTEPPELDKMNPKLFKPIVRKYVIRKQEEMKKDAVRTELLNLN
ncbi:hypothetical protein L9F63_007566 [Diploptera punctata]|uniref:Uncharacterized protein n=1 Tax=Diploptera punctata TaxID=6984 RepID=A0AAD7Z8T4_DIPPU|nr:hypothetical protein L9F63_007566 [Diploptera punctata]